jgi:hypothetical protein
MQSERYGAAVVGVWIGCVACHLFSFVSWGVAVVSDSLFGCCAVYVESNELVATGVRSFRWLTINGN